MKCLLLLIALCLAVSLSLGEAKKEHWAKRLQTLARNSSAEQDGDDPALKDILKNVRTKPELRPEFTFKARYPYNPLVFSSIETENVIQTGRAKTMAKWNEKNGPAEKSFWNKLIEQEKSTNKLQTINEAAKLALGEVTKVIEEFEKSVNETCYSITENSITGQMDAPKEQKLAELTATIPKMVECAKLQMKLINLDLTYESGDAGLRMPLPEVVVSTLVHNATLISKSYTDCAAVIVTMAAQHHNESCFREFTNPKISEFGKTLTEVYFKYSRTAAGLDANLPEKNVNEIYTTVVDLFKKPISRSILGAAVSEYLEALSGKSNNRCAKDLMKSVIQAAIELDIEHKPGSCIATMQEIAQLLYVFTDRK